MKLFVRALFPLAILIAGFLAWKILGKPIEEPKPAQQERQKLKTEALTLHPGPYQILLQTQGTVRAEQNTTITPLVSGTIQTIYPAFEDGAFFNKGEVLLELDPADLQTAVSAAQSRLARAQAAFIQEEAKGKQARLNWQDIGYQEEPSPLVLRVPQLREAQANVSSAMSDLEQAQRNLTRSKVRAPFDGRVDQRSVGLGQAVGATTPLGTIFGSEMAEVRLPLSPSQLPFINLPKGPNDTPVPVLLSDALTEVEENSVVNTWKAEIVRTEGTLDESSRELFAIARIHDPFSLSSDLPQLRIGQPLRASVTGIKLSDVFVIPRSALRGINEVFLIEEDPKKGSVIQHRDIRPIWSNAEVLVIRDGFKAGDRLSTSNLPYRPNGAPIEILPAPPAPPAEQAAAAASDKSKPPEDS